MNSFFFFSFNAFVADDETTPASSPYPNPLSRFQMHQPHLVDHLLRRISLFYLENSGPQMEFSMLHHGRSVLFSNPAEGLGTFVSCIFFGLSFAIFLSLAVFTI